MGLQRLVGVVERAALSAAMSVALGVLERRLLGKARRSVG